MRSGSKILRRFIGSENNMNDKIYEVLDLLNDIDYDTVDFFISKPNLGKIVSETEKTRKIFIAITIGILLLCILVLFFN